MIDNNGLVESMEVDVQGLFIPGYNEDGNLIDCSINACPPSVLLVNNIQDGIHQAAVEVTSNGKILSGDNTLLKAGESILLNAGFTVEAGAEFEAKIEACGNN